MRAPLPRKIVRIETIRYALLEVLQYNSSSSPLQWDDAGPKPHFISRSRCRDKLFESHIVTMCMHDRRHREHEQCFRDAEMICKLHAQTFCTILVRASQTQPPHPLSSQTNQKLRCAVLARLPLAFPLRFPAPSFRFRFVLQSVEPWLSFLCPFRKPCSCWQSIGARTRLQSIVSSILHCSPDKARAVMRSRCFRTSANLRFLSRRLGREADG